MCKYIFELHSYKYKGPLVEAYPCEPSAGNLPCVMELEEDTIEVDSKCWRCAFEEKYNEPETLKEKTKEIKSKHPLGEVPPKEPEAMRTEAPLTEPQAMRTQAPSKKRKRNRKGKGKENKTSAQGSTAEYSNKRGWRNPSLELNYD